MSGGPSFSPFPCDRVPRIRARDAAIESVVARWIAARPFGARVAQLAGGPVVVHTAVVQRGGGGDPHPVVAEVRAGSASILVAASGRGVRALVQRLVGGPAELDAPRPPTAVETAIWTLAVATVIADWDAALDVWPVEDPDAARGGDRIAIELAVDMAGTALTVVAHVPRDLAMRVPPARPPHAWWFDVPIVVARCALPRNATGRLAVRDVVVVERDLALAVGDGALGLTAAPGAVEGIIATGYVRRDMALPDDAHVELTVQLGTTRMSLRQLGELAVGQVVSLGRPLAGPYEIHAAGRLIGQGELVDVDGELGVRIVALAKE